MKRHALRSPLAQARGLGSAKDGFDHWWVQRITAIALAPLAVWFVISILTTLMGATRFEFASWLENPWNALLLAALVAVMLWHARLGIQVVLEDYVHTEGKKLVLLIASKFIFTGAAILGVFAIIKLHFFGV